MTTFRCPSDVLIVYSSMEHVTWKSPGPMCGWVGRILHPDSCTSVSSWSKVPLLSIWKPISSHRPMDTSENFCWRVCNYFTFILYICNSSHNFILLYFSVECESILPVCKVVENSCFIFADREQILVWPYHCKTFLLYNILSDVDGLTMASVEGSLQRWFGPGEATEAGNARDRPTVTSGRCLLITTATCPESW